ncbi:Uncharacterised protein [uncultured archaeon]|nr:Uncharacterised protein [uncultured archaeon]
MSILLDDLPAGAEKAIKVIVRAPDKTAITRPIVRLYSNGLLLGETTPDSGVTSFDAQRGNLILTAYKEGYAPVQLLNPLKDFNYLTLIQNTESQSLKILVNSFNGLGQPGTPVSLLDVKGNPLGIPDQTSGLDGSVIFQDVPTGSIIIKVGTDSFPVTVPLAQKDSDGNSVFTVTLSPRKKKISFSVFDSYSNSSIPATVTVGSASCTIVRQSCTLLVSEDALEASASADGYDTTSFTADFNAPNSVFLNPSNLQSSTSLNFLGVFDAKGVRVSSLLPNTQYTAEYLFKDLKINYTRAVAHIRLSSLNSQQDDTAKIIDFSPTPFNFGENYASANDSSIAINSSSQVIRYAEFQKLPGSGNQQISVTFLTTGGKGSTVTFQHKTTYETLNNVIRNPTSTTTYDFLAPVATSFSLPINFQGDCVKDGCITTVLKSSLSQSQSSVQTNIGDEVVLDFNGFAPVGSTITVSTSDPEVKIVDSTLDNSAFNPDPNSASSISASTLQTQFTGSVVFKPLRYSQGNIKLVLQTPSGTITKSFILDTIGKGNLQVDFTPKVINFEQTTFKVNIKDAQTQEPILGAKVMLGGSVADALAGKQVQVTELGNGDYSTDFTPEKQGSIPLKISATGYSTFTADIPVNIENIIDVSPASINLQVLQDSSSQEAVTVTNLLGEPVTVSGVVTNDNQLKYSQLSLQPQVFNLKPRESRTVTLNVVPNGDLIKTGGDQPVKIVEDFQGTLTFNARAGLLSDIQTVSLQGNGNLNLEPVGKDWTVSATDLEFDLSLPTTPVATQKVTVANTGTQDLLINVQDNIKGIKIQPASAIIPAGGQQDFTLTGSSLGVIYDNSCLFNSVKDTGNVDFIASYKGVRSLKSVAVTRLVSFDGSCMPSHPIRIPALTDMYVDLLPVYRYKQNQDGSVVVQNEQVEKVAFSNALISGTQLIIPMGSDIILETSRVNPLDFQGSKWLMSFPIPIKFALPLGFKDDSSRPLAVLYTDESFRLTFPLTAQLLNNYFNPSNFIQGFPQAQAQQLFYSGSVRLRDPVLVAQVLPNELVKMERLTADEQKLIETVKGINESCYDVEQFPAVNSEVQFTTGTRVSYAGKDSQTFYWDTPSVLTLNLNNKLAAQLPAIRRIYFSQPVQTSNLAGKPTFNVPAGTSFTINICTNVGDSLLVHKLCLPKQSLYTFSQGSDYSKPILTPPKCENIEFKSNELIDSWPLGFSQAKYSKDAIIYTKSATNLLPIAAGVNAFDCVEFTYCSDPSKLTSYYQNNQIQGLPFLLLVKPNGEQYTVKDSKPLSTDYSPDFPVNINLNDKSNNYRKSVILYFENNAPGKLQNAGLDYDRSTIPDKVAFTKEDILPKDPSLQGWLTDQGGQRANPTSLLFRDDLGANSYVTKDTAASGSRIEKYKITFQAPPSLIDPTTGCLKSS